MLRLWKRLRDLGLKRILYAPRLFSAKEKYVILGLLALVVVSGGVLFSRLYLRFTLEIPDSGGTYEEALLKEPRNINPLFATNDTDRDLSRLVFSGLFSYSSEGELVPDLAESLEISDEGKIYKVILKKDGKWHDGAEVSADDVVFTVRMAQNPLYKSPLRANWQGVEVEALDRYSVRFSLRAVYSPFVENLTLGIIPKHLWENISPEQTPLHELNLKPIGSGPYKFYKQKQDKDGSLIWYSLTKNANYHREGPYISELTFFFFRTEEEAIRALRREAVSGFGPVSLAHVKELEAVKGMMHRISMPRIFGIFFNDKENALLDKKVRGAISQAMDREKIIGSIVAGGVIEEFTPFPFLDEADKKVSGNNVYDPEASRKILEEAGWKLGEDGIRHRTTKKKNKETTENLIFTLITADLPDFTGAAESIKKLLGEIGVEINIKAVSFSDLESNVIRPRNFEILLFGQIYGYEPDPFAFWHSSQIKDPGLNVARFANKKADELLEDSRRTSDRNSRDEKYREAAKIIADEVPAIFLYSQAYLYFLPAEIKGVNLSTITLPADRFNEISKWYLDTKRVFK